MPKDSLNIYLTATDGMSPVLASITDKTKALDKETQQLHQTTNAMTKASQSLLEKQVRLQSEYDSSRKHLKDCQKAYDEYQDEISKLKLDNAIEQHAKLKNELVKVNEQLNANKRAYKDNVEAISKGTLGQGGASLKTLTEGIFAGQIGQMFSNSLGQAAEAGLTSMIGTPQASLVSDMVSNAISGAAAGTLLPVPGGAAIGVGIGALSGLVSGGTKIFEAHDDAFKDYYGGLYEDVSARPEQMIAAGSATAAGREKDKISFTTLFGDRQVAEDYLDNLVDMANYTPFLYDDLTAMSKTLATYGYSAKAGDKDYILDTLQTIGDTGAALGMGTSDMTAVATALGRMKSSDKTTLEYLNILNDRGIGAVGMLAEAKGVSVGDMYGMISKGEVSGTDAVEIITAAMRDAYAGSMEKQSKTFEGITSTLEGLEQELENAGGEGYNTLRQSGKSAMVDAYGGELGDALKEINAVLGENQARKENLQDQYYRDVVGAVLNGSRGETWNELDEEQQKTLTDMNQRYTELKQRYESSRDENGNATDAEAGAELESLYEQAEVLAQSYFDNSEFVQMLNDTELDEVEAIRENTAGLADAAQATRELTEELSKGLVSTVHVQTELKDTMMSGLGYGLRAAGGDTEGAAAALAGTEVGGAGQANPAAGLINFFKGAGTAISAGASLQAGDVEGAMSILDGGRSHAFGLDRVPFDGYPALLHEGERVLTAREAREQDRVELPPLIMQRPPAAAAGTGGGAGGTGGGIQLTVTGNDFVGTGEEMADQLMEVIVRKLETAFTAAGR